MEEITLTGSLNICVRGLVIDVFSMFTVVASNTNNTFGGVIDYYTLEVGCRNNKPPDMQPAP